MSVSVTASPPISSIPCGQPASGVALCPLVLHADPAGHPPQRTCPPPSVLGWPGVGSGWILEGIAPAGPTHHHNVGNWLLSSDKLGCGKGSSACRACVRGVRPIDRFSDVRRACHVPTTVYHFPATAQL